MAKKPKHSPVIVHPPRTDHVQPGDRVRVIPTGARATVVRTQGRSVVLEMDEAFAIPGASTRTYYSYPGELEVMPRVGTMGAEVLYAERDGERPEARRARRGFAWDAAAAVSTGRRECAGRCGAAGEIGRDAIAARRPRRHQSRRPTAGGSAPRAFVTATSTAVVRPRSNTSRAIARIGRI